MSSGDRRMAVEEARSWWLGFWEKGAFMGWSVLRQPIAAVSELVWYGFGAIPPEPLHGDACHCPDQAVGALWCWRTKGDAPLIGLRTH
jgi:hypothetical protein